MHKYKHLRKSGLIEEIEYNLEMSLGTLESLEKASYDALSALHEVVSTRCSLRSKIHSQEEQDDVSWDDLYLMVKNGSYKANIT